MTLEGIRRRDPAFDETRFLSRAEATVSLVLRARSDGRPEQARAVVSDDMALRLRTELESRRAGGRRQVPEGVRVRSAEIIEAAAGEQRDTVAVRVALEGAASEVSADGAPPTDGQRRRWAEVWWFQRQAGATTPAADDAPLDRCPGCGAPVAPTSAGECAYCRHRLLDPSAWVLSRISDGAERPPPTFPAVAAGPRGAAGVNAASRAARTVGVIVLVSVLVLVMGGVGVGVVLASRATKKVGEAIGLPTSPTSEGAAGGVNPLPSFVPVPTTAGGFITPVANPRVRAPVNDLAAAAAAVQATAGRPLLVNDIHLYGDGRIVFEVQAVDDPRGSDIWGWRRGAVTGPEQGPIAVDPAKLFPLSGVNLTNLARLCDAALAAAAIPDGVIDSPYLLRIGSGLRWYIPIQSEARTTTRRTYRVAPDGTRPEVF